MSIVRVCKTIEESITIHKYPILDDHRLSFKAKGILTYLHGHGDRWQTCIEEMAKHTSDGVAAIKSGLKELQECGYAKKSAIRDERGHFKGWDWEIYEMPRPPKVENQLSDIPKVENQLSDEMPKVENQLSGKTIENTNRSPKVENRSPKVEKPKVDNRRLLDQNKEINKDQQQHETTTQPHATTPAVVVVENQTAPHKQNTPFDGTFDLQTTRTREQMDAIQEDISDIACTFMLNSISVEKHLHERPKLTPEELKKALSYVQQLNTQKQQQRKPKIRDMLHYSDSLMYKNGTWRAALPETMTEHSITPSQPLTGWTEAQIAAAKRTATMKGHYERQTTPHTTGGRAAKAG